MFKRLISFILALTMVLSVCPVFAAAETTEEETEPSAMEIVPETTEAAAETESATGPEETVTGEEPEATVVETEPEETVTETEPEETVIETEPEETVVETEPEEPVTKAAPKASITYSRAAGTAYETFAVGETKEVTLDYDESVTYSVTVSESGMYTFYDEERNDVYWELYKVDADNGNEFISDNWMSTHVQLEAGVEYELIVNNYDSEMYNCVLKFIESVNATKIDIWADSYRGLVGETNQFGYEVIPWYSSEKPTVTSSDPSLVNVESVNNDGSGSGDIYLNILGEGTAVITATLANGKKDTFPVTGVKPTVLTADEAVTVDMVADEYAYFSFTPATDGSYTIWEEHNEVSDAYLNVMNEYSSYITSGNGKLSHELSAGVTYIIQVNTGYDTTMTLTVTKSAAAEEFFLSKTELTVQEGAWFYLEWSFTPINAKQENVTWTSSDESIVFLNWSDSEEAFFMAESAGTATLTATTESGLVATCTVTVEAIPVVQIGETIRGTVEPDARFGYAFVAPATATYALVDTEGTDSYWEVNMEDGEWLDSGWVYEGQALFISCEEGVRYLLTVDNWQDHSVSYAVSLQEATAPEAITIRNPRQTGFVGQYINIDFSHSPFDSDPSQIQWTVDNDCAVIDYSSSDYVNIRLNNVGTAVVTATLPNGTSASCTITVKEPVGELFIGTPMTLDVSSGSTTGVVFTAPENASYMFWNSAGMGCSIEVIDSEGSGCGSGNPCEAYLYEGETYLVLLENYSNTKPVLNVAECVDAESISIENTEYSGFVGQYFYLELIWDPINSSHEDVAWTSSDPEIAEVYGGSWGGSVNLLAEGTVTITATTNSGKTAACTVTVKPRIALNVGSRVELTLDQEECASFQFTAPDAGDYVFWVESSLYLDVDVQKNGDEYIYGNNNKYFLTAEKGDVFTFFCRNYLDGTYTFVLNLDETTKPTSIKLSRESCIGYVDDYVSVDLEMLPGNAASSVTWTSSDDTVAEVRYHDDQYATIGMLKEGTATITASTDNGLSDSFTITVMKPEVISVPYSSIVTIPSQGVQNFLFTPTESGYYAFWNSSNTYCNIEVQDPNGEWIGSRDNQMMFYGEANETYMIKAYCYSDQDLTYSLHLDKCADLESVQLGTTNINGIAGNTVYLEVSMNPGNAYYQNVTWDIADPDIANIRYSGDGYVSLYLNKAGTTTLTVNVDGKTATATISVTDAAVIQAPYSGSHTIPAESMIAFSFTPEESGTYVFWDASGVAPNASLSVSTNVNGWIAGGNNRVQFEAKKGVTYFIEVENYQYEARTLKLKLDKAGKATEIKFETSALVGWVGQVQYLSINVTPLNGGIGDPTFTVSDTSKAEIIHSYTHGVDIMLKKAGTVTVTATSGNLKTTCTITIKQPETVSVGYNKTVTMAGSEQLCYLFTPTESGSYTIWDGNDGISYFTVCDSNNTWISGCYSRAQFDANAGETYRIYVYNNYVTEKATLNLHLEKVEPLTDLNLSIDSFNAIVGQWWLFIPEGEPANADLSGIYWSVDNENVVRIEDPYAVTASLHMVGEGTATVTVTVGEFTDSCKFVVESGELVAPVLKISGDSATGKPTLSWDAVLGADKYEIYRATSKSGTYKKIADVTDALTYQDTTGTAGKTYYYYIVAVSPAGSKSDKSNIKSRMCDLAQPVITLSNVSSSGQLKVSWEKVDNAVKYEVYRATSEGGTYSLKKTTTSTSYTDTSVTVGKTYYYKVKAIADNTSANSAYSDISSGIGKLARPDVTISNVSSSGKIKLSWKAVSSAVSYEIYRADSEDGEYVLIQSTTELTWTDTTAEAGTAYYYRVKAIAKKAEANSALSSVDTLTCDLARPTLTLTGDAATGNNVVNWTAVDDAVSYKVYRATSKSGTYKKIADVTDALTYQDTTGTVGKTYYYKVIAIAENTDANSAYSSIVSRTCDLARPVITLSNVSSSGKIKISWTAISKAVKYTVYRADSEDGPYTSIKTTTSTSYTDTSAKAGKTYYYKVKAIAENTDANSAYSVISSSICKLARPDVTISNVSSSGKIKLSWAAVSSAVRYEIYRTASADVEYTLVESTTELTWTDATAEAGITYYYKVKAIAANENANSVLSTADSLTCDLARPTLTLTGDAATGKNIATWTSVEGAVKYRLYRATSKSGTYSKIAEIEDTTFTDSTATVGKTYYYKVIAIAENTDANSAYSSIVSRTRDLARPVITLSNVSSSGKIKISWTAISKAVKYTVYRADSEGGTYTSIKTTTSTSYTDTSAKAGKTYYYKVKAIAENTDANSAYSVISSSICKLARPDVTISNVSSSGKIKLSWAAVSSAVSYEIYRTASADVEYTLVESTTELTWTDSAAETGITYYYKVKAIAANEDANSVLSTVDSLTCKLARPDVTIELKDKKPNLSWEAVDGAISYKVYRATSKSGTYSLVKTTTSTSYKDSKATAGKTYYYKVMAISSVTNANSAYSSVDSIKSK